MADAQTQTGKINDFFEDQMKGLAKRMNLDNLQKSREAALQAALAVSQRNGGDATQIVTHAETFLAFLTGGVSNG